LDWLAIRSARQETILELSARVEFARKHKSDHEKERDNQKPDQRAAPAGGFVAVVRTGHSFPALYQPSALTS
jgi:hypothetical protein